jgi:hypothetical protein
MTNRPEFRASSQSPAVAATERLTYLLGRMGDALAAVDAKALLEVESELGSAIAAVSAVTTVGDRAAARAAARKALAALLRCRRLGATFSGVARTLGQRGRVVGGYNRLGGYVARAVPSSVLVRA